mgnify:CR=1 FL=1
MITYASKISSKVTALYYSFYYHPINTMVNKEKTGCLG